MATDQPNNKGTPPGGQAGGGVVGGPKPQQPQQPQQPVKPTAPGPQPLRPGQIPGQASAPSPGQKPGMPPSPAGPGAPTRVTLSKGRTRVGINFKAQQKRDEEERKVRDEEEAKILVEDRVFAIPGTKEVKESEVYVQFMEKVATKLVLPDTSWFVLEAFSSPDVTAERVSHILKANPYFESIFFRVVANLSKREEMPSAEGAIVLLGMQNFRNLVIASQMYRTVQASHPEWDADGKLKISPGDSLKYAGKVEEFLVSKKADYADMGYVAGLLFDFLVSITNSVCEDKKKVLAFLDATFNHGLRTAQIAAELSKHVNDLTLQKYVFSAALLHDIGKVGMAIVRPGYINFLEDAKKKEWSRPLRQFVEQEKWGVDHSVIGSLICHYFKILRPISKVVQFHHEPFLLRSRQKGLYPLAGLICLSTNIANAFKKIDKLDDPLVAQWKGTELQDFRIDMRKVVESIANNIQI